jgi:hypothetical protein
MASAATFFDAAAPFRVRAELDAFLTNTKQLEEAKKAAIDLETEALDLLLDEIRPNMRFLDAENDSHCYRDSLVLINKTQEIPLGERGVVEVEDKLTLYEDRRLTRSTVVTIKGVDSSGVCNMVLPDERGITTSEAIEYFGFDDICESIIFLIKDRLSSDPQLQEYHARTEQAGTVLASVRRKISTFEKMGAMQ